ncbi:hypothetical protein OPV22_006374 [Ensete ventricosum]|uniref:Glycosyltransferase family 92 protein n=1 Tax=Ensete ventricosum TaxID=4639 RepID=A0AAV8RIM4_ENSVE|nr:hypothetical protein OPV22_006374 [Ensete ventricosum]
MPSLLRAHYSLCHLHLPGGARWVSWADVDATLPFRLLPTGGEQNPRGDRKEARVRMLSMCGLLHRWRRGHACAGHVIRCFAHAIGFAFELVLQAFVGS